MAAYIVIEIHDSNDSIGDLNANCQNPTNPAESVQGVQNLLSGILAGTKNGTVKIVTKDASTVISTSGSGSESNTYSFA